MEKVPLKNIKITDSIWSYYRNLTKNVVIPYQWEALNDRIEDASPSGCINNFKISAGEKEGNYVGMVFQDSDLGKRRFLDIINKYADYIYSIFGEEEGKIKGYDGHEEVKLALMKLYHVTANENYLKLADYFLEERGKDQYYFNTEWENNGGVSHWSK